MDKFSLGTDIIIGKDSRKYFESIKEKRIYVVTDKVMQKVGAVDKVTRILSENDNKLTIFEDVLPNPTVSVVKQSLEQMINQKSNVIIAIGGGSVIDTAKAVMYFCIKAKEELIDSSQIEKPLFIAVPTTSGTGSEVTSFSVLTDDKTHNKIPIVNKLMLPDIAVLDAEHTLSVPNFVTADTGMDVITHAIEAYVSSNSNDFTDMYAEKAIKLAFKNILSAYDNGDDINTRESMHYSSCMAGVAFNNAGLGINHSLAHAVGGHFNISHGKANAVLLPHVISYNSGINENVSKRYKAPYVEIASMIGLKSNSDEDAVKNLINYIMVLNTKMNIPNSFKELGISKSDYDDKICDFAISAIEDVCTKTNIRNVSKQSLVEILKKAY